MPGDDRTRPDHCPQPRSGAADAIDHEVWKRMSASLRRKFSLTRAELDVLQHLLCGRSVTDIALTRSTAEMTVRNQLRSLFAKSGTRRQSELLALVFRVAIDDEVRRSQP